PQRPAAAAPAAGVLPPGDEYRHDIPPSTANRLPVANAASSEARKVMIPSTSSGRPPRPSGIRPTMAARAAASSLMVVTNPVSVEAGNTTQTLNFYQAYNASDKRDISCDT